MPHFNSLSPNDCDEKMPRLTIAERVERGRETQSCSDGAILPFPAGLRGQSLIKAAGKQVERLLWAGYRPTQFEYRSAEGEIIQVVLRLDHDTERKEIRPLRYCGKTEIGFSKVIVGAIDGQRPLYGLDRLADRPDAPVLVVEGEKTAEAAAKLFPDHVAITWMSGANSVHRAEMLALRDRKLVVWPDNDQSGRAAMRMFAAFAYAAEAASVKLVDVPGEFGEKWDLADAVPAGYGPDYPLTKLLATARLIPPAQVAHLTSGARKEAEQRRLLGHAPGYSRVKLSQAETALSLLDPDMNAAGWHRLARCIYLAFGDAGLEMFDTWSSRSTEKYKDGEPAQLWTAFGRQPAIKAKSLAWMFRSASAVLRERAETTSEKPNVELDREAVVIASIDELNEDHAVVVRGGKTGVLWENYDPRFRRYSETYLSRRDFIDRFVSKVPLPNDHEEQNKPGTKTRTQGNLWFNASTRRSYDGVHFTPGEDHGPKFLNLWRGFAVEPHDDPTAWALLKEHLFMHVAGEDNAGYEYLLNWLAFAVQHLERPIGTAIVLIGKKGAGKSIVTELFGRLFGQHTFVTSRMDDVLGRFNDRLETTVLLGLEEAVAPQNRAADGTLKDLITRQTLRLEGKFFGVWDAPNHLRIIVTSNNEHVVRADGAERRYAVFEVTNPHQTDANQRRHYFGQMVEQMENGGYSAMLGELLARDITNWNAEIIPETEALQRQKISNLINDPVKLYLYERLTDGCNITSGVRDGAPIYRWSTSETVWVPVRDLCEDFLEFAKSNGIRVTQRLLSMQIARYMPHGFGSQTRRGKDGDSTPSTFKAYPFPPLEEARCSFDKAASLVIEREDES